MILRRFYEDKLAHASFLVGNSETGEAIVIEPNRDLGVYLRAAEAERLKIVGVTETHIHADFVSGSRELAAIAGARLYLSDEGDAAWKYAFAKEPNVTLLRDGDTIRAGAVRLEVLHTPGHTPEHLCFLLVDESATEEPQAAFTGDFLFAGDVGRPDLLERAAQQSGTMEESARTLFRSIQDFKRLPAPLILWPSHGAGSACGKHLGDVPATTLGYEMLVNPALRETDEDRFVADILAGQPEPPTYFKHMKRINKQGPPPLGGFLLPPRLDPEPLLAVVEGGDVIVDLRGAAEFAKSFIPGTLNIPAGPAFTTWAGWLLPYERPIYLLCGNEGDVAMSVRDLALIGIDNVKGWGLTATALNGWLTRHGAPDSMPRWSFAEAQERVAKGEAVILDVRGSSEYAEGHVPGATHVPLGYLTERAAELPRDRVLAVHCAGGNRSPIAASVLRGIGFTRVADISEGFNAYVASGAPVENEDGVEVKAR